MKIQVKKFQQGGPVPEGVEAPMEGGAPQGGSAEEQLAQLAQELVQMLVQQLQDPNAVAAVLQMALQMISEAAGGAQGQPVFRKGGKLAKRTTKACGGARIR